MGSYFSSSSSSNPSDEAPRGSELSEDLFISYVEGTYFPSLDGKVVAITGTTTGLGYYLARIAIAKEAKSVLLLNRKSERAEKAEKELKDLVKEGSKTEVKTVPCDLMSLDGVRETAEELNKIASTYGGLDVLCNNAGIMAMADKRTEDGFEVQMQTNQLSPFLLTKLVFKSLEMAAASRGEARVVMQSSEARNLPRMPLEEAYFLKSEEGTLGGDSSWTLSQLSGFKGGPWGRYHQSKLANSAFAMAFHNKLQAANSKVKSLTAEPGYSVTSLQTTSSSMPGWMDSKLIARQSAADGSLPAAMACFNVDAKSGDMFAPEKGMVGKPVLTISDGVPVKKGTEKLTCDPTNQKIAWEACEKGLGVEFSI